MEFLKPGFTHEDLLKIDEDKLRKVLAEDPDIVYQMMGTLDSDDEYSKNGVAQRIGDVVNASMTSIKSYAGTSTEVADGSSLGTLIQDMQQKLFTVCCADL